LISETKKTEVHTFAGLLQISAPCGCGKHYNYESSMVTDRRYEPSSSNATKKLGGGGHWPLGNLDQFVKNFFGKSLDEKS
jgi:hypothetical protein